MKLHYKALWVENETDFVDAFPMDRVEQHIKEQGFEFEYEVRSTPADVQRLVGKREYDLLIVDYNITEDDFHGSDLIKRIRDNKCLTEVIFYSSAGISKLHSEAADKQLEGVFFSTRREDQLVRKITDVFDLTVEKVLDLNNMRGIVMASVADLDVLLEEIIRTRHNTCSPEDQSKLCKKIAGKIRPGAKHFSSIAKSFPEEKLSELQKMLKELEQLDPADFHELMDPRRLDSSKRIDLVVGFCEAVEQLGIHKDPLQDIRRLLLWRNALAHQRPELNAQGFLEFEVEAGVKYVFDNDMTKALRLQIRDHVNKLETVLAIVKAS